MKNKTSFTAALIALGLVSAASAAPIEIHVTGSTAFRAIFFAAAQAPTGGIFDNGTAQPALPAGANNGSGTITYLGKIGGTDYALECSWTGSEAGIANVDGVSTLANPGLPNGIHGAGALPGASTTFPTVTGATSGGFTGAGDLTLADTSQAVSLTKPPAHPALVDLGVLGVVTFTWAKGANSTPNSGVASDTAWKNLSNVTQPQMALLLAGSVPANFLTGVAADNSTPVLVVGRNAGSGTRVNTLLDTQYGVSTAVSQIALNSKYAGTGGAVLTYQTITTGVDQAANQLLTYPSVATSLGGSDPNTTPNALSVINDGYDSGGGVSQSLSCDQTGCGLILVGYVGISDALNAVNGHANTAPTPNQPSGAVLLKLDGMTYDDSLVVNGAYSFWGHEHLYTSTAGNGNANVTSAASAIKTGIKNAGGLGAGVAGQQNPGIQIDSMLAEKAGGGDVGYPAPGSPAQPN